MKFALIALMLVPFIAQPSQAAAEETVWSCQGKVYSHEYNEVIEVLVQHGEKTRLVVEYKNKLGKFKKDFGLQELSEKSYGFGMADQKGTMVVPPGRFRDDGDGIAAKFAFVFSTKEHSRKQEFSVLCKRPYSLEELKKKEEESQKPQT